LVRCGIGPPRQGPLGVAIPCEQRGSQRLAHRFVEVLAQGADKAGSSGTTKLISGPFPSPIGIHWPPRSGDTETCTRTRSEIAFWPGLYSQPPISSTSS